MMLKETPRVTTMVDDLPHLEGLGVVVFGSKQTKMYFINPGGRERTLQTAQRG